MHTAIKFDDELRFVAAEIRDVAAQRPLTSKLRTAKLTCS